MITFSPLGVLGRMTGGKHRADSFEGEEESAWWKQATKAIRGYEKTCASYQQRVYRAP